MRARFAALLLLLAAAGIGTVSVRRSGEQLRLLSACEAARAGDWAAALAGTEGRSGPHPEGRAAAECRCRALVATGRADACAALLETVLDAGDPDDGWAPAPALAVHLIQTWRDTGRSGDAARLARRAARAHPDDPDLFYLELVTRGSVTADEPALLRELAARVPEAGPAAARMRVSLATRHLQRGDPARALAVLGAAPPRGAGAPAAWVETRELALAAAGDRAGLERHFAGLESAGADADTLRARYALALSIGGLRDPARPTLALLEQAWAARERLADPVLAERLALRLVITLVAAGRHDEALAVYDRAREHFELAGLSRDELLRAARQPTSGAAGESRRGELRFAVANAPPGAALLLSPPPDAPPDAAYERLALPASGHLAVSRRPGPAPLRWVLVGADERPLASGVAEPRAGRAHPVAIEIDRAREAGRAHAPEPAGADPAARGAPPDGRRRVFLVLLDCADWQLIQYLRARRELPVLDAMLASGFRAVLESDPPLTAAALESLVWPGRDATPSFLGVLHQLGTQLAGLASVGENPLGALAWLLPEQRDLFAELGAGPLRAANLLFAHGGIDAGRHARVTGPGGAERELEVGRSGRDLDAAERARWPELAAVRAERDRVHLRAIAAELDAARSLARAGDVDFLALRVEPLDLLTHAHFAAIAREGRDDGAGLLFAVYRYLDARLGELAGALDADDVLIAMSDHGIRSALQHSRDAFFVATGTGVPRGRAPGRPRIAGVSRAVADLLGTPVEWPDTGVAPFARALASAPALGKSPP